MRSNPEKYIGQKFNRLTILKVDGFRLENGSRRPKVLCKCDCGNEKTIVLKDILNGKIKSCTCLQNENPSSVTHGKSDSTEYRIYNNMINRCTNKRTPSYQYYGARGIKVCDRWMESFENFYADMGDRPSLSLSLDRINNDGNYEPSNCRWATHKQQEANKRIPKNARLFTKDGVTKNLKQWAEHLGINYQTLFWRINSQHKTFEQAITK